MPARRMARRGREGWMREYFSREYWRRYPMRRRWLADTFWLTVFSMMIANNPFWYFQTGSCGAWVSVTLGDVMRDCMTKSKVRGLDPARTLSRLALTHSVCLRDLTN